MAAFIRRARQVMADRIAMKTERGPDGDEPAAALPDLLAAPLEGGTAGTRRPAPQQEPVGESRPSRSSRQRSRFHLALGLAARQLLLLSVISAGSG